MSPTFDRRSGIGGSDAGKIAGVSPFGSAHDVWLEKMGLSAPLLETEAMEWGKILEPAVLAKYARESGNPVITLREKDGSQRTLRHPDYPWMYAHVDARTKRKPYRGIEAKTTSPFTLDEWGEPGTDQVPGMYHLQCQHYMAVTGWEVFDLPVLIGGQRFRIYSVPRDEALIGDLIAVEAELWDHVQRGEPPAADGSSGAARLLAARFPEDDGTTLDATPEHEELLRQYLVARAQKDEAEKGLELVAQRIKETMGAASVLAAPTVKATYKTVAGSVAWKGVAEFLLPADSASQQTIISRFRSPGTRRLTVTTSKGG